MEWEQVSIPKELLEEIRDIIKRIPYWTSESEFVRDAIREKIDTVHTAEPKVTV